MKSRQEGYVIVTLALGLLALVGFGAFAVDLGVLYSARTAAQQAADAAALAGASTFIIQPQAPQPETASSQALNVALTNSVLDNSLTTPEVAVNVDAATRLVSVTVLHRRPTFLARALGLDTVDIQVQASAEASQAATGSNCAKPWFIPNTVLASTSPCDACASGGELLIANGTVTPFALGQLGRQISLKPQRPQDALAPSQFYAIELGGPGASDYRDNIAYCAPLAVYCQQSYSVKTGNMVGPTKQGVQALIGSPPDLYLSPGRYQAADGSISDTSRSLIVAPVWDVCNSPDYECPGDKFPSGTNVSIPVSGFALVFVEGIQGNDVVGRLIGVMTCQAGAVPSETGPFAVPLRLVRTAEG